MRKTIIVCDGGLGNRLNSLFGGLFVSKQTKTVPVICWPENNWCGCSFSDLFVTDINIINNKVNEVFEDYIDNIFLIHENQTNSVINKQYAHSLESLSKILNKDEHIVYYHNALPSYVDNNFILNELNNLKIKKEIVDKARAFTEEYNISKNTYGVIFRKTDYASNASFKLDDEGIYNRIKLDLNSKYYICSDDKNTEDAFNKLENVCIHPKTSYVEKFKEGGWNDCIIDNAGRRNNFNINRPRQSVIEAFIDLLILSRTNIIVNGPSTFLHFAKYYSAIKF